MTKTQTIMTPEGARSVKTKKKLKTSDIVVYVILSVSSIVMFYPFVYMVLGAVCTPKEFAETGLFPWPSSFDSARLEIFLKLFSEGFWKSLAFTLGRMAYYAFFTVFTSVLLGYLFAKIKFVGRQFWFMFFMVSMMVPGVATMVPTFVLFARFPLVGGNNIIGLGGHGFINEWPIMFITGLFGIYNVFLVRQSISDIPDEFREAAEVDGAGFFRIVFGIYMPMVKPILYVLLIGLAIGFWNDYFFNKVYAYGTDVIKPVGYYVTQLIASYQLSGQVYPDYPTMLGISTTFVIFPIVFYMFMQKRYVTGFSIGGLKE